MCDIFFYSYSYNRKRLRQYPALLNCTTIDWFLDWPKEALIEVASTSLDDLDILATITGEQRVSFPILDLINHIIIFMIIMLINYS